MDPKVCLCQINTGVQQGPSNVAGSFSHPTQGNPIQSKKKKIKWKTMISFEQRRGRRQWLVIQTDGRRQETFVGHRKKQGSFHLKRSNGLVFVLWSLGVRLGEDVDLGNRHERGLLSLGSVAYRLLIQTASEQMPRSMFHVFVPE